MGDTAELHPYIYSEDETPVAVSDLSAVNFTVKKPDQTIDTFNGALNPDGSGFLRYTETDQKGLFVWTAQFIFTTGEKRSYRDEFSVYDPMEIPPQSQAHQVAEQVWFRLEDCFDAEEGGPWLRDMTLSYFDPSKIERFIPEGLLEINTYPPITNLDLAYFTTDIPATDSVLLAVDPNAKQPDPDRIVIVQGTLLAVIKHLMRSYVEQPDVRGANAVYQDRRDYLQRWQSIYQLEYAEWQRMIALWKRQFLNYGRSSLLIGSKAGRLYGPAAGMRLRNTVRGYY
jgi:hypothetical protein